MIRVLLVLVCFLSFSAALQAQSTPASSESAPASSSPASTDSPARSESSEAVQIRIGRARALIAAHQLETAASELESIRAATHDSAVRDIASVMLMSIYLEAGNYGRAEALLEENFRVRSQPNGDSMRTYFALAGQAVNGARTHLARYRTFGISTTDSSLPAEAVKDLDRLRSFLERMIAQAKDIANERKAYDSLSLLEDVLGIRLSLEKDAEDQSRWSTEYAGARELLASRIQIASLGGIPSLPPAKMSMSNGASRAQGDTQTKASNNGAGVPSAGTGRAEASTEPNAGSLNSKATKRVFPSYPPLAKQVGAEGLVRVHVVIDEHGKVVEVSRTEGPGPLRQVAEDAARQWSFEAAPSEGRPARVSGYIEFNFTL